MEFRESIECKGCGVAFTPKYTHRAIKYCTANCANENNGINNLYGINRSEYNLIWETQGCQCAICGTTEGVMVVDHCHDSGKVRGILCDPCNLGIGYLKDNTEAMQRAIGYVTHAEFVRP